MTCWPRVWLPILALLAEILATAPAHTAQYTVDGFTLGDQVAVNGPNYQSYACKPSNDFADATRCERTQQKPGTFGNLIISNTLIHAQDGKAICIMAHAAPVSLSITGVKKEIEDLSREFNARPVKIDISNSSNRTVAIAVWGQIKLDDVKGEDLDTLASGKDPHLGVVVDTIGDILSSSKDWLPVYQITGGAGYLYVASFDATGRGHRQYVAIDPLQIAVKQFQHLVKTSLQKDQSLAKDDYRLWSEVALATRNLALDTSPKMANDLLDEIFDKFRTNKLHSHVWSLLPTGAIRRLAENKYSTLDVYGSKTTRPDIRSNMENYIAVKPSDPFIELAYFIKGDLEKALELNPKSVIGDVLHYAIGLKTLKLLLQDTAQIVKARATPEVKEELSLDPEESAYYVTTILKVLSENPDLYDRKSLDGIVPNFAARAAKAQPHFEAVLAHPSSAMADDAAYLLGSIAYLRGKSNEALGYFSQAMAVGNADYKPLAWKAAVRILAPLPYRTQLATVESNQIFVQQPVLWYLTARSGYREHDYAFAIDVAQRALKALNIPVEQLPVTTDPDKIQAAIQLINSELSGDLNAIELPYILQASKEILQYKAYLDSITTEPIDVFVKKARAIIIRYSMLVDEPRDPSGKLVEHTLAHQDLRQALYLIDLSLQSIPKNPQYDRLREWLHYRKVRILAAYEYYQKVRNLAAFAPQTIAAAVAEMEKEMPASQLLDDALAEEIFAEGVVRRDVSAAEKTFRRLLDTYPNGNAVDNAYTWMAISYRCVGRLEDGKKMSREIIRRFPVTRHAKYALERLANPEGCGISSP